MPPRRAVIWLIAISTAIRLLWSAFLPISNDEAYHWLYTTHPDLSYFDHPPMTMLVAKAGLLLCGGWVHSFSLRLGFVLFFAGSLWILFRWTSRWFGEAAGFWAAVGLSLSNYFTAWSGSQAHPDSPLLFFGLLTLWQSGEAILGDPRQSLKRWLFVGLAFGAALLSKYHAVLLPAGVALFALFTKEGRRIFFTPGPYLAVAIGFALFSPVILWNVRHDWTSFRFQGSRAVAGAVPVFHEGPLKWLLGPILYLFPWIWFWLVWEGFKQLGKLRSSSGIERLLFFQALAPLGFFFVAACFNRAVFFHWPLIGFVPLYPLVGAFWVKLKARFPLGFKLSVLGWTLALFAIDGLVLFHARTGLLPIPSGVKDVSREFSGWDSVAEELQRRGLLEGRPLIVSPLWDESAQLAFALRNSDDVRCWHSFDARGFEFWSHPDDTLGRTALLIVVDDEAPELTRREYSPIFETFELAAEFTMTRGGTPFRKVTVYRGVNQSRDRKSVV